MGANVIVWDLVSRKRLLTLDRHSNAVTSVTYSPNGRRLVSASRLAARIIILEGTHP